MRPQTFHYAQRSMRKIIKLILSAAAFVMAFCAAMPMTYADVSQPLVNLQRGFVTLADGTKVYASWSQAQPGQPTVLFLNGSPDTLRDWDPIANSLSRNQGYGTLSFDFLGQGLTQSQAGFPHEEIDYKKNVRIAKMLCDALGIDFVVVAGLSYGAALGIAFAGTYPQMVQSVVAMAPPPTLKHVHAHFEKAASCPAIFADFLPSLQQRQKMLFWTVAAMTLPVAEPSILAHPYGIASMVQLAQGMKEFDADAYIHSLPPHSLLLVQGKLDKVVPSEQLDALWERVPEDKRLAHIVVGNSPHRLPQAFPKFMTELIIHAASTDPHRMLDRGGRFEFEAQH